MRVRGERNTFQTRESGKRQHHPQAGGGREEGHSTLQRRSGIRTDQPQSGKARSGNPQTCDFFLNSENVRRRTSVSVANSVHHSGSAKQTLKRMGRGEGTGERGTGRRGEGRGRLCPHKWLVVAAVSSSFADLSPVMQPGLVVTEDGQFRPVGPFSSPLLPLICWWSPSSPLRLGRSTLLLRLPLFVAPPPSHSHTFSVGGHSTVHLFLLLLGPNHHPHTPRDEHTSALIFRRRLLPSLTRRSPQVSDCSFASNEHEMSFDRDKVVLPCRRTWFCDSHRS